MKNFIRAAWFLLILSGTACHSNNNQDKMTDTTTNEPKDTSAQHQIQQPPVSADSAGARKTQEKSSVDTMIKKRPY